MTLEPHQGQAVEGSGTIRLFCGGAQRHLRVNFIPPEGGIPLGLPGSKDGKFGPGTTLMRLPLPSLFFVFVTSGHKDTEVIGESEVITADRNITCQRFELYLLNCLIPEVNTVWDLGDWLGVLERTTASYGLTRVSLPVHELNLTHKLTIKRKDNSEFSWSDVEAATSRFLLFLSFANCSQIDAPVTYGFIDDHLHFFQFRAPDRTFPTNRRSWATQLETDSLHDAFRCFQRCSDNSFWDNVISRAVSWQCLVDLARYESNAQALFTVQMLLEMLAYVVLVEDAAVLGEDGYGKLPASDRITLLCGHSGQSVSLHQSDDYGRPLGDFFAANSIANVGELIAVLRNKLIHPTKKNREYLSKVPPGVRPLAISTGLQISSLVLLKTIGYRGTYFNTVTHKVERVPWSS